MAHPPESPEGVGGAYVVEPRNKFFEAIRAVADYACENAGQLLELDVNPLLVSADGAVAVWLLSDDNNSAFQRTVLLRLRWMRYRGSSCAPEIIRVRRR